MKIIPTAISDVFIIEPRIHRDQRGWFFESFNDRDFTELLGQHVNFVQDNSSMSMQNVLRGLHYQIDRPQGKLTRVVSGEIFDVAVDIRRSSTTFGQHVSAVLSSENRRMLWIPPGFAHGFLALSKYAEVAYKVTDYWMPDKSRVIAWNDQDLDIPWPLATTPILSEQDKAGVKFSHAEIYE